MSQYYQSHGVGRMDDGKAARSQMAGTPDPTSFNRTALKGRPGRREPVMRRSGAQPLFPTEDHMLFRVASVSLPPSSIAPSDYNKADLKGLPGKRELPPRKTTRADRDRAFDQYMGKPTPAEEAVKYVPPEIITEVKRLIAGATGKEKETLEDMLEKLQRGALSELNPRQELIYAELMKQFGVVKKSRREALEDEGVVFSDEEDDDDTDDDNDDEGEESDTNNDDDYTTDSDEGDDDEDNNDKKQSWNPFGWWKPKDDDEPEDTKEDEKQSRKEEEEEDVPEDFGEDIDWEQIQDDEPVQQAWYFADNDNASESESDEDKEVQISYPPFPRVQKTKDLEQRMLQRLTRTAPAESHLNWEDTPHSESTCQALGTGNCLRTQCK